MCRDVIMYGAFQKRAALLEVFLCVAGLHLHWYVNHAETTNTQGVVSFHPSSVCRGQECPDLLEP